MMLVCEKGVTKKKKQLRLAFLHIVLLVVSGVYFFLVGSVLLWGCFFFPLTSY